MLVASTGIGRTMVVVCVRIVDVIRIVRALRSGVATCRPNRRSWATISALSIASSSYSTRTKPSTVTTPSTTPRIVRNRRLNAVARLVFPTPDTRTTA